ncbi:MAG: signal recognition particle-docking protein FtsY [Actinomycetota bacterium]|nr:MAG: signal recognition particle-docking protein FtsY [Actinomycetota bacterium]
MKKIFKNINMIWARFKGTGDQFWDELEEQLISSDISINTAGRILDNVKNASYETGITSLEGLKDLLKAEIIKILDGQSAEQLEISQQLPTVYLVVGVNGVGKTSAIAKMANMYKKQGKKIIFAAADTYRSAAVEQLTHFADILDIDVVNHQRNADPGAVVYDSLEKAIAKNADMVIIDTAGRMQTSYNLMEELKKIKRVVFKRLGRDPDEVLLVIDSTTGQNARSQAEIFLEAMDISGIILTKTDGTSRGGIVLTIKNDLGIPVKLVTEGEKLESIYYFDPVKFTDMIFS